MSLRWICSPVKIDIRSPNPSRQPQTFESDHENVVPPHCRASNRHTKAAMRSKAPGKSSLASFSVRVRDVDTFGGLGGRQNIAMITNETKPIAGGCQRSWITKEQSFDLRRLIQKQNLHVSLGESVKTPPRSGPAADATPYILVTTET